MPKIFNKILCPIGFDRNSAAALKFAHELADPDKSTLYLLHVVSAPSIEPTMLEPNPVLSEGIAERELERFVQQHMTSSAPCRIMTRRGVQRTNEASPARWRLAPWPSHTALTVAWPTTTAVWN